MGIQLRQSEDWNRSATEASKSPPAFISADKGPFAAASDEQLWQVIISDAYVNGWTKIYSVSTNFWEKSSITFRFVRY